MCSNCTETPNSKFQDENVLSISGTLKKKRKLEQISLLDKQKGI